MNRIYFILILIISFACSNPNNQSNKVTEQIIEKPYTLATPKPEWVKKRVTEAKARLTQSDAGQILWKAMRYHGGLEKWWSNGPVYYRFNYQPKPGTGVPRDTYETADYWSSKTRHQRVSNQTEEYGWDGSNSWYYPNNAEIPYNTRFWALTPYYFAGMPFVFADAGVFLKKLDDTTYEGKNYQVVKATFGEDIGDAPDDYYILYVTPETGRLAAIRYIVSYPAYFKKGEHTQEKLMTYEGEQKVNGITFPVKHRTFMWEADGTIGKYVTDITLSDIEFKPNTEQSYFDMPAESFVMEGLK